MLKHKLVVLLSLSVFLFSFGVFLIIANPNTVDTKNTESYITTSAEEIIPVVSISTFEDPPKPENLVVDKENVIENVQPQKEINSIAVIRSYYAKSSWYKHGKVTANGEKYNPNGLTLAHRSLPFGTLVRLTNPENRKSVTARVNDRGPYIKGREFDISLGCALAIGMKEVGVTTIFVEIIK